MPLVELAELTQHIQSFSNSFICFEKFNYIPNVKPRLFRIIVLFNPKLGVVGGGVGMKL